MTPMPIAAMTAVSALGIGRAAHLDGLRARRGGLSPNDFDPMVGGWIGRVAAVEAHRLPAGLARFDCRNNRLADLALRADGFADAVAAACSRHGAHRIGLVVGTSTSGVEAAEEAYRRIGPDGLLPRDFDFAGTQDLASLADFLRMALGLRGPASVISTACASSARCFMDGTRLIDSGLCDAVVVGGADSLCRMTLHGFAALELIAPGPTRPCDALRDGISVGEAAGFALLERDAPGAAIALLGWGASSDAHHMSHPHPEGAGAIRAMSEALDRAGLSPGAVDWVKLHGTGTRANDAMEDRAVHAIFGDAVPVSSTKGWTGHTLGACGILETVMIGECISEGLIAGCLGVGEVDPDFRSRVIIANQASALRHVVTNSFGFGGVNCSLVLGRA
ncbi:beta-ketoacyl-[acyl-carrier-protein] synthase family protein [Sediminicoccus sp. KRV36]|uniref:beta-ketoacyl-[acyl-carrier-protein] synthase family protein n=1 Tax=Sediminicoccus sp. KRV36 TaxID=3133721 RepID=UPI00200FBBB8|nr:beta-ketoacyl-[acyl-carrier-protein] synthase family protein [Sediminicoccus rosea]UPY37588.1 beta-ketoacyl-[acyl-carrier-protein] synthase family protein [Sediminicoccus rosea]